MSKTGPKPMPRLKCCVDGCASMAKHPVSGLCGLHYERRKRTGGFESTRRESGSGTINSHGYLIIGSEKNKKGMHVLVAEKAIWKPLPKGAEVHHVNGIKSDNRPENLVVCPSRAYHKLLHTRQTALEACGNPSHRKCPLCKQYDDTDNMKHNKGSRYYYHAACKTAYNQSRKAL